MGLALVLVPFEQDKPLRQVLEAEYGLRGTNDNRERRVAGADSNVEAGNVSAALER